MTRKFHRRTFLRGLGTAMALPWLEAMSPLTALADTLQDPGAPLRSVFLFIPNGVHQSEWSPLGTGRDWQPSAILEPLESVRDDVLIISGLAHQNARALGDGPGDHARSAACFLTGAHPFKTAGDDIHAGVSADQIIAASCSDRAMIPSLQLGTEGGRQSGNCDSGYSCAYSSNISWAKADQPMPHETQPRRVFERMFLKGSAAETSSARRKRISQRASRDLRENSAPMIARNWTNTSVEYATSNAELSVSKIWRNSNARKVRCQTSANPHHWGSLSTFS